MPLNVIVPVHHGAGVLHRSVRSLSEQAGRDRLRVVLAVNDGLNATSRAAEEEARDLTAAGVRCEVVTTAHGRSVALNAAEALSAPGPTLYLDQDAALSPRACESLSAALAPGTGVHFTAPALRLPGAQRRVPALYYDAWQAVPYVALSPVTVGAYAVSEAGRRRWGAFPAIHSDDKWARRHFLPTERTTVEDCHYEVLLPDGFRDLVRARRRYWAGNYELEGLTSGAGLPQDLDRHAGLIISWAGRPSRWPSVAVLLTVHALAAASRCRRSGT